MGAVVARARRGRGEMEGQRAPRGHGIKKVPHGRLRNRLQSAGKNVREEAVWSAPERQRGPAG